MRLTSLFTLAMSASGVAETALAQSAQDTTASIFDRSRNTAVRERVKPEYDPTGVRVGSFLLEPRADLGFGFTSNLLASENDEVASYFTTLAAAGRLASQWSRHSLAVDFGVNQAWNLDRSDFTYTDLRYRGEAGFDIGTRTRLNLGGGRTRAHELPDTSPLAEVLGSPTRYVSDLGQAEIIHERNRFRFVGRAQLEDLNFSSAVGIDGVSIDQSFRDRDVLTYGGRIEYAITPSLAALVDVERFDRNFDSAQNANSSGVRVLTGVNFDASRLLRGEVAIGRFMENRDDGSTNGLSVRSLVEFFPDELVTVTVDAQRDTFASNLFGASNQIFSSGGVGVDYELRRNIIIGANGRYERGTFGGLDRSDRRWNAGISLDYRLNRVASLYFRYGHEDQQSAGVDRGRIFATDRVDVTLRLRR